MNKMNKSSLYDLVEDVIVELHPELNDDMLVEAVLDGKTIEEAIKYIIDTLETEGI